MWTDVARLWKGTIRVTRSAMVRFEPGARQISANGGLGDLIALTQYASPHMNDFQWKEKDYNSVLMLLHDHEQLRVQPDDAEGIGPCCFQLRSSLLYLVV